MKLPNGYGSVKKMSGKRRKPYIVKKTAGWEYDEQKDKRQDYEILTNRKEGDTTEKYGLYDEGYYYILPNKFTELMEENNLSPLAVKKQLAERGYIKIQKDRNRIY